MFRVLAVLLAAVVLATVFAVAAHHKSAAGASRADLSPAAGVVGESLTVPTAVARPPVPRPTHRPHHHGCTATNWRHRLKPAERWIDAHESGLDPLAVEPSTHAFGLGQLLPSTYRGLGLPMSADPCDEIHAQRAYLKQHYGGSWSAALRHKRTYGWW